MKFDFGGYATRNDLKCGDGRVIRRDAFKDDDGIRVPLVWQHQHNDPDNVLGHAVLENRKDGVYAYCKFNDSDKARSTKALVEHGDVTSLSIHANQLIQKGNDVLHGKIREVSVVLAGANPGALIDNLCIEHSDGTVDTILEDALIYSGFEIEHSIDYNEDDDEDEELEHADDEETIADVFNTFSEKQKNVVYAMLAHALADKEDEDEEEMKQSSEGGVTMHYNAFEAAKAGQVKVQENTLSHAEIQSIFEDAKRIGSLKRACLEHSITDIEYLFPDYKLIGEKPELIMRDQAWVSTVWNGTQKSPFARIRTLGANLTADEARAKGYIKGKKKLEEVITLLRRSTDPQTVYKKQSLDRDDIIDITDFSVVAFLKSEMQMMLREELSRAILVGDGRMSSAEDKIKEDHIRPIYLDDDLYTIHYPVTIAPGATNDEKADALIEASYRSRKDYKGSGSPTLFIDPDGLTSLLLYKDKIGRRMYNSVTELATAMRVSNIVEVPILEGVKRTVTDSGTKTYNLMGLIVNLSDYTIGMDRGGQITSFEDFDIDYNKEKYLIETRLSGALRRPYSAIALEVEADAG